MRLGFWRKRVATQRRVGGSRIGQGYETAKSRHLFRDFVDATAAVTLTDREVLVRFQKRAHNPLLLAAGLDRTDVPVPCPPVALSLTSRLEDRPI
jgi:hypothetical protein